MYIRVTFINSRQIETDITRFCCNGNEIPLDRDIIKNCFIDGDNYIKIKGDMYDIEFYVRNVLGFTV